MSDESESFSAKRQRLAADIARQRTQLAGAYRDIAKPILYTEYTLRGFGFLRQNPWILTIVPAAFSTTSSVLALIRNFIPAKGASKKRKWFGRAGREAERAAESESKRAKKSALDHVRTWGGHGVKAFKIYRRVRSFFP